MHTRSGGEGEGESLPLQVAAGSEQASGELAASERPRPGLDSAGEPSSCCHPYNASRTHSCTHTPRTLSPPPPRPLSTASPPLFTDNPRCPTRLACEHHHQALTPEPDIPESNGTMAEAAQRILMNEFKELNKEKWTHIEVCAHRASLKPAFHSGDSAEHPANHASAHQRQCL